jgi:hypothetical protein
MNYGYSYNLSSFPNEKCDISRLNQEVHDSIITIALDYINKNDVQVTLYFKAELSDDEEIILSQIIANHSGDPFPDELPIVKAEILTEGIQYVEAGDTTQSFYRAETLILDVSSGDIEVYKDFSWPFNIGLKSATLYVRDEMVGDEMHIHEAPNTLIGVITQPLNVGDTSLYASDTVFDYIHKGYYIGLYQPGDTGIEISVVISIDIKNKCLEIYPSDVSADAGSYVAMCSKIMPYCYLTPGKIELGKTIPTAQRLPANVPIRLYYKNNNGQAKQVCFFVEYFF